MVGGHTSRLVFVTGLALSIAGTAMAQSRDLADAPERVPVAINPAQPADMSFEVVDYDFGTISDDAKAEYVFKFRNAGTGELRISSTKGSCSCTVPAPSKRNFAPGEEGEIRVIFDPTGKSGAQHQVVTINTNDAETPVIALNVRALVLPQVMVKPKVGHFGEVAKDEVSEIEVKVIGRNMDFEVTKVELSDPDQFEATFGETVQSILEPAPDPTRPLAPVDSEAGEEVRECIVKVRMLPGQDIGLVRNKTLTIHTNDPKRPTMTVELMAQHAGDINMTPRRITLGSLPAGAEFHREVTFRSLSGEPFRVLDIEHTAVAADSIDYAFEPLDPDNPVAYRLTIDGEMPEDTRVLRGRFVVKTDVDREESLYLHYYGQLRPAARTSGR